MELNKIRKQINTAIGDGNFPRLSTGTLENDPKLFVKQVREQAGD